MILEYHTHIEIRGERYAIVNSHRAYFTALKICRNKDILEEDKAEVLLPILFKDEVPTILAVPAIRKYFELFMEKKGDSGKPCFDLIQDAQYVYAGFMQAYGIDLDETTLPVEKFVALLRGLPPDTKLAEIIKIRTMPIPAPTKYNAEQRQSIIRAKASVRLESDSDGKGFRQFGQLIKEWAKYGR